MAKALSDPEFEIVTVDTDTPLSAADLRGYLSGRPGVTLLVRSASGKERRGGYFFQIEVGDKEGEYILHPLDQQSDADVYPVEFDLLLKLVNQMSGRKFDKEAMLFVRRKIDMRSDD